MTDSYRLATNTLKTMIANSFVGKGGYYVFLGAPSPYTGSDANVATPTNAPSQDVNTYNLMVCGKVIASDGIALMTRRVDWAANTVYTAYSDTNSNLYSSDFYACVNASAYYHVFKCLDNNGNTASTVPPNFADTSAADTFYQTTDGYVWKYLYTISKSDWDAFTTTDFMPVVANSAVTGNASSGAIDVIKVTSGGAYYSNYIEGQWNATDIQIGGNTTLYAISNTASSTNGYYTNCIITIIEGTGKGQFREVTGYNVVGLTKEIVVNGAFTTVPDSTSQYAISPKMNVVGDGKQTVNVIARALINAATSNSVYRVEILERGSHYRGGTANVCPNPYVPVSNVASFEVIIPPPGGHGADIGCEIGATAVGFSVKFSNTESNTISSDNDYRQVGIVKDPLWANIAVNTLNSGGTSGSNGTYLVGETVYQVKPMWVGGNVSINTTSAVITGTGTDFGNTFAANNLVLVKAGSSFFVSNVASITNSTSMTLGSNGAFTNSVSNLALLTVTCTGVITNVGSGTLRLTNVSSNVIVGAVLLGKNSYTYSTVNNYTINGVTKGFSTFNQRTVYSGTLTTGTFVEDEYVYQTNAGSNVGVGIFHSTDTIGGITKIYLTNETGTFGSTGTIVGNTSGAVFTVTNKYPGDLVVDSGEIVYIENVTPVSRSNNQSEVVKVVLEL